MRKGFSLIEILVAIGVFSVILASVMQVFVVSLDAESVGRKRTHADFLAKEYLEEIQNIRTNNWDDLVVDKYIIENQSGNLTLVQTTTGETVGDYMRYLNIDEVYRDSSGAIVDSGGSLDPSTKKITVTISWQGFTPGQVQTSTYLTRYRDNLAWEQTTEDDFNAGTLNAIAVTNTDDGEVVLGAGGHGDWCRPGDFIVNELNLPDSGVARRVKAIEGKAFTGKSSGGGSFVDIDISNEDPPVASIANIMTGYETNDVFIDQNYAYIATNDVNKDLVVVDLTTNQEVAYFDGNNNFLWWPVFHAQGIYVRGNVGYLTIGPRFYTINLTNKAGSLPRYDWEYIDFGLGYRLHVVGDYAYVAMDYLNNELRLMNIANPSNIFRAARANVNGARGQEVFVNETGTRAYLATSSDPNKNEFFIINTDYSTSQKNNSDFNLQAISSYNANGMDPKGVTVVTGNRAILVGQDGEEYQVVNINNENNPVRCGGIDVNSGIYGVSAVLEVDGDAYSYIVTGDTNNEFKIIEGGPGGNYASSGIFESQTLDTNYSTAFNRFYVNFDKPSQTNIQFQTAVLDPGGGDCSSVTFSDSDFVGPDGTSATFFPGDDAVPLNDDGIGYENPGQCFRFRAYLSTTDYSQTPTLYDFTVNYSP